MFHHKMQNQKHIPISDIFEIWAQKIHAHTLFMYIKDISQAEVGRTKTGDDCYNFFPLPRLFPHLRSMTSLLLLCSLLPRDRSVLTCFPILLLSSCTSSLVSPCSTGLSHSLVTSLMQCLKVRSGPVFQPLNSATGPGPVLGKSPEPATGNWTGKNRS